MATVEININDISELDDVLDSIVEFDKRKALTKACLLVERSAKINCPVNTGELRNSITYEVDDDEGQVGTNLEYAPYVEYGTGLFAEGGNGRTDVPWVYQSADGEWHSTLGQEPQPYLRPALDENRDAITQIFKDTILEGIKKYGRL